MLRKLILAAGFLALAAPVVCLYLRVAAPGPATAGMAAVPMTPTLIIAAIASFLIGWVTITAFSFPQSSAVPVPETSNNEGGIPIMRRQVRVRWAESANPAA